MNFWPNSAESMSSTHNQSFYFEVETPRGHLFVVLDFAPHDYANLDATLERKLLTMATSFDSVPGFSADMFLGFLAKETNNFLYDLDKQSGGPELCCSGALCLISGGRITYVLCGDTQLNVFSSDSIEAVGTSERDEDTLIPGGTVEQLEELGVGYWDSPLADRVPFQSLEPDEVVVITAGGGAPVELSEISETLQGLPLSDSKAIGEALTSWDENLGTLLVVSGPYDLPVQRLTAKSAKSTEGIDHSMVAPELIRSALEAELEQRIGPQIEELREALRAKANSIDLLELNEILKNLGAAVTSKADTTEVLELQRDVLRLGLASTTTGHETHPARTRAADENRAVQPGDSAHAERAPGSVPAAAHIQPHSSFNFRTALGVLAIAIAGAFTGAWLQARVLKKSPEVWAVKTSGNQIWINRMDQNGQGNVTINLATPVRSRGEQTFSSFADVKHYIVTISIPAASDQPSQVAFEIQPTQSQPVTTVTKVEPRADESKVRSESEKTASTKSTVLTASARKPQLKTLKKPVTSGPASPASVSLLRRDRRVSQRPIASTTPVKVGTGDTLIKLAHRYKATPDQIKKLNPQINEQNVIRPGQKLLVPVAPAPKDAKGRRVMLVKQTH
jgi:LysM repeat protein